MKGCSSGSTGRSRNKSQGKSTASYWLLCHLAAPVLSRLMLFDKARTNTFCCTSQADRTVVCLIKTFSGLCYMFLESAEVLHKEPTTSQT